ncbi:uncharacterized protein K452DRAFT_74391 [Aplosporella prunicola CBS 121167]|uniref:Uncharacterized protein n=1 Tax=Aplosporella prunicola CBS 121167 TaxID=1176127 RepID=A0A6A6B9U2_9PEZI|nr:uncharacterized protein K452DRAFT_74391 [Aplosporella prunicola CBS 121167]KAF2139261.1 hypothetical protein K452DRAFT_74391 [Aplosporella prunicola CBS 121167]
MAISKVVSCRDLARPLSLPTRSLVRVSASLSSQFHLVALPLIVLGVSCLGLGRPTSPPVEPFKLSPVCVRRGPRTLVTFPHTPLHLLPPRTHPLQPLFSSPPSPNPVFLPFPFFAARRFVRRASPLVDCRLLPCRFWPSRCNQRVAFHHITAHPATARSLSIPPPFDSRLGTPALSVLARVPT